MRCAELVLPAGDLDATIAFFVERLGFQLDALWPADGPRAALLSGHGLRLRLDPEVGSGSHARLRLTDDERAAGSEEVLLAPNGASVLLVGPPAPPTFEPHTSRFTVSRIRDEARWGVGRAGMEYRDLIPDREGGRVIASHIRIPRGGPVPDYTHYHHVGFQVIFCHRGWVEVAYEGQGPAFVLRPGDLVLQAPRIRHRVISCSDGLEVVEVTSPAEHETRVDHGLELPGSLDRPDRDFCGQRFHRHVAPEAAFAPCELDGFEAQSTGVGEASGGAGSVRRLRAVGEGEASIAGGSELHILFVRTGRVRVEVDGEERVELGPADACRIPARRGFRLSAPGGDCELLEVKLPGS
ncbi:MAG TPA: cupin [Planctomycetes bacterium]|nr:cupin [Planctomycetota bacterium]